MISMKMALDIEANKDYWLRVQNSVLHSYDGSRELSLEAEVDKYASLEDAGRSYLSDAFLLLMSHEQGKFKEVKEHATAVLHEAIKREKFTGYQQAWGLEGQLTLEEKNLYHLRGTVQCNWWLYLGSLLDNNSQSIYLDTCTATLEEYLKESLKQKYITQAKSFLDNHWFMWSLNNRYAAYIEVYERYMKASASAPDWKNRSGSFYVIASHLAGNNQLESTARRLLNTHCLNSLQWSKIRADYPWWERFCWVYLLTFGYLDCRSLNQMLATLKGVSNVI